MAQSLNSLDTLHLRKKTMKKKRNKRAKKRRKKRIKKRRKERKRKSRKRRDRRRLMCRCCTQLDGVS
ncbi:hypothetical protein Tco_1222789, partial [Tanacetum coccineum]